MSATTARGHAFGCCPSCGGDEVLGGWCPSCGGVPLGPWEDDGLCVGRDPATWTPDGAKGKRLDVREALELCGRCPVRRPCLRYAERLGDAEGVWGGVLFRRGRAAA
jgi:WhiB family transcriptional regulator, redox-sensing transcriptional regulator